MTEGKLKINCGKFWRTCCMTNVPVCSRDSLEVIEQFSYIAITLGNYNREPPKGHLFKFGKCELEIALAARYIRIGFTHHKLP